MSLLSALRLFGPLLESLDLQSPSETAPTFLESVSDHLIQAYAQRCPAALDALAALRQVLESKEIPDIQLFVALQKSLVLWIKDEAELVPIDIFNREVCLLIS
jgi:hypothetical protein